MQINLYELELLEKISHQEKVMAMKYVRNPKPIPSKFKLTTKFVSHKSNVCCA